MIDFDVAHIGLPYNAILGYPALSKFMAVIHHAYNLVKLPSTGGTIVICGVVTDALYAAQAAYKAAAVASPADEDEDSLPRPPAKKKHLFSQEKAATKQVPLEASGSGASVTIGANLPTKQESALVTFLRANSDMFAWTPSDMSGVPREDKQKRTLT